MTAHSHDATIEETPELPRDDVGPQSRRALDRWKRVGAGVVGGTLLAAALKRRSIDRLAFAFGGGLLAARALGADRQRPAAREDEPAVEHEPGGDTAEMAPTPTVARTITIGAAADELSAFVRDAEHLDEIVGQFAEVVATSEDRHHWLAEAPLGRRFSWEMRLVEDRPGEFLGWEADEGTPILTEWTVAFEPAPGDRGTEVRLEVTFDPPGGPVGDAVLERLNMVPGAFVNTALDRFKSLVETGSTPTIKRNPSGRGRGDLL